MYIFLAALGLLAALLFGALFFSAESAIQETTAATAASAALLFSVTMMLGHLGKVLNEQKEELQKQAEQLRRQTEYLRWMQDTAERIIAGYVTSRSKSSSPSAGSSQNPSFQYTPKKEPDSH